MVMIDIPMPENCYRCPCFDTAIYGHCRACDIWFGAEDGDWLREKRPSWCPIREAEKEGEENA